MIFGGEVTQSIWRGDLTSVRGLGASTMLSRDRARNSDAFSPDDLHAGIRSAELSTVQQHVRLFSLTLLPVAGIAIDILERQGDNSE